VEVTTGDVLYPPNVCRTVEDVEYSVHVSERILARRA